MTATPDTIHHPGNGAAEQASAASGTAAVEVSTVVESLTGVFAGPIRGLAYRTPTERGLTDERGSLWLSLVSNFVAIFTIPLFGGLSDRIGRKKIFITGIAGSAVSLSVLFWAITTGSLPLVFITGLAFNGLTFAMVNAAWPATYAEIFRARVRLSGIAVGTQFAFPLAGFTPTIAVALAGGSASGWAAAAGLGAVICLIAGISVALGRETFATPAEELGTHPHLGRISMTSAHSTAR